MHIVDTTMFFSARSGGVKRYLLAKHDWLSREASHVRHTILVPAPQRRMPFLQVVDGAALSLPDGYRLPLQLRHWRARLEALEPDLIEAADPLLPAWAARQVARRMNVPAVAFYHSDVTRLMSQRFGEWAGSATRAYLRQLYDGFDLVLAPSRMIYERLVAAGIPRVHVQPLGVDVATFSPHERGPDLRASLELPANTRLLVYAGRLAAEKNVPLLLDVIQRLGDPYHLLIVGGRTRERITANATVLPYQRNPQKLARVLASCDAFIHAGDTETYGLVVVEAMACGLPVIAAAQGPVAELVDDEVGCLASRLCADEMADAAAAIFERDPTLLGERARARACARHAWSAVLPRLLHRYHTLTGRAVRSVDSALVRSG